MRKSDNYACLDSFILTCREICVEKLIRTLLLMGGLFYTTALWADLAEVRGPDESLHDAKKLLDKRKWPDAVISFRALLKQDPASLSALVGLSTALTYTGKREEALSLLTQAAANAQGNLRQTLIRRSRVVAKLFLTNDTFKTYQEGLNLIIAKKYRLAKDRLEKALSDEPDNLEILVRLGQCLVLDSSNDGALERLTAAKKLNPYEPEAQLWLGRAYYQKNVPVSAIAELKNALSELPGSELAPVWLAETLYTQGQTNSALRVLNNDTKTSPFHVLSLIMSARYRIVAAHSDTAVLWSARKDLQLAMSRIDQYMAPDALKSEGSMSLDLRRPVSETRAEIQKLILQIQSRLDESSSRH
jgi:tetratricopeptide (TPR) repeat protein